MFRLSLRTALLLAFLLFAKSASAACQLGRLAELPVTMIDMKPTVPAKINGAEARFVADSGAFFSEITPANAAQYHLSTSLAPNGLYLTGIGGSVNISVAEVKAFTLATYPIRDVQFLVGGGEVGGSTAGLLGQNVWRVADVEYDLAGGAIRLMRPHGCDRANLAYWANGAPISVIDIDSTTDLAPHTIGRAMLNGVRIRVLFDTGSQTSMLTLSAAARAGIKPGDPGVKLAGYATGIGRKRIKIWLAPVAAFQLGDELIKNTELQIGDIGLENADMLLGADFFLSHRVYVANSQDRLYFTYSGGPVFTLAKTVAADPPGADAAAAASPAQATSSAKAGAPTTGEPTDADGFSRRGAAFAARRQYSQALADLDRACALAPDQPRYFYQRALVRINSGQPFLAMADLDATLKLKPDEADARVTRAILKLAGHDVGGARADMDAAAQALPKEADLRLSIAELYLRVEAFDPAIEAFNDWIPPHSDDSRLATAMNGRCWARALADREIDKALSDCNTAVRLAPQAADPLDSRGLVRLRRGEYERAIADYDASLKLLPKSAWSLYGRGLAELRMGDSAHGRADIEAATALAPRLPERARKLGLAPPDPAAPSPSAQTPSPAPSPAPAQTSAKTAS